MGFALNKYDLTIKDPRTNEPIATGVMVFVYDAGTKTLSTIYGNDNLLARTNPITRTVYDTIGKVEFWAAATSVDIFIADDRGNTAHVPGVTPTQHVLQLHRDGISKCFVAPFIFNAGGTEVDTGLDFPLNTVIQDFAVEVVTVDATETLNVGLLSSETNGDADGICVGASLASATFLRPWTITNSTTEDFVATTLKGDLLGVGAVGSSANNDFGQPGGWGHIVTGANARSLSYTPSTSDTGAGYIYVFFRHLR